MSSLYDEMDGKVKPPINIYLGFVVRVGGILGILW